MSADFRFPSAAQRRAMRAQPGLAFPLPAGNPAHLAKPAADCPASCSEAVGNDWILELPCTAFDRPSCDPGEQGGGAGESPSPELNSNVGVWNSPAAGISAVPVAAMEAVMIERMKHFDHGHDLAADVAALADNPLKLSHRAQRFITFALEDLQFHKAGHRARAKHHIAQAAAMLLAFYDAVDAEDDRDVV